AARCLRFFRKHRDAQVRVLLLLLQHRQNLFDYGIHLLQDHIVPEPDYAIALRLDELLPLIIVHSIVHMLAAIELDYQLSFDAAEVCDVGTNRELAAKFQISEATSTQQFPDHLLRVGHVAAQFARVG
ncbi:MAG: hypothetical protein WAU33_06040, partial [Candidatus Binataceae bacterium]